MKSPHVQNYIRRLRPVYQEGNVQLLEYHPTLFRPLLYHFEPLRLIRRIRLTLELFGKGGYRVYYLAADDRLVGHCVVAPGGRRLKCSTEQDIVIGPYYIAPTQRGKQYSKTLIGLVLAHCSYAYERAYDWIEKDNIASIRASEACGFKRVGELNVLGFTRRLEIISPGEDWIYCYEKRN